MRRNYLIKYEDGRLFATSETSISQLNFHLLESYGRIVKIEDITDKPKRPVSQKKLK